MRFDAILELGVDVALAQLTGHELVDHLDAFRVARVVIGQHFRFGHGCVDGGVVPLQIVDRQFQQISLFQLGISGERKRKIWLTFNVSA